MVKNFSKVLAASAVHLIVLVVTLSLLMTPTRAAAQSDDYKITKNLEIQYNILRALSAGFVDSINFDRTLRTGIDAMLESLDPYTEYVPSEESEAIDVLTTSSYGGIGAMIRKVDSLGVIIVQPYALSPAVTYGLEVGDVILTIDGEDVKPLSADECSKRMRGTPGTKVLFKVKKGRTGQIKDIEVVRGKVHTPDVTYAGLLVGRDGKVTKDGYIYLSGFTVGGGEDFRRAVQKLKDEGAQRIIIDLRGNGGGVMEEAVDVVSAFVPKGTLVVSAKGRGKGTTFEYETSKEPIDTQIPVLVLVNSGSASASEIVSGALQDWDRATIIGTRTFGKGLVQTFRDVGYGGKLKLTISKYYTPSGRCIQIMDYSHRNSDGSVASVPDSLKREFKTLVKGRSVYDGGGITPDTVITASPVSRAAVAIIYSGVIEDYAVEYYKKHPQISPALTFKLSDADYNDFIKFALGRKLDLRSGAEVAFDQMVARAKEEGLYDANKEMFEALAKKVKLSNEEMLKVMGGEIRPMIEAEIAQKYYFNEGRVVNGLKADDQLWKALNEWK